MEQQSIEPGTLSELIPRTRIGDETAQEELLVILKGYLARVADRHLEPALRAKTGVSDVVQLSFVRIIENFEQFRGSNSRELRAWLKQIVANEINNIRRHYFTRKRDLSREANVDDDQVPGNVLAGDLLTPSSEAMRRERVERFHLALQELPADQSTVIQLRNIEQLSFQQIGERMNRSPEAASQLWYRAVLRFEQVLSQIGESGRP